MMHAQNLEVREADTVEDFVSVWRLVHDNYVSEDYITPRQSGMFVEYDEYNGKVLIVTRGEEFLGTVSICQDSERGLPHDINFPEAMSKLREQHDIGSVYQIHTVQQEPGVILQLIAAVLEEFCADEWHWYVGAFHPKHEKFYNRVLGMQRVDEQYCESVDAPGVLMLGEAQKTCKRWNRLLARRSVEQVRCAHWPDVIYKEARGK